jgi:phospholipid/cholesterol/gamma-HCH transport system permease protein
MTRAVAPTGYGLVKGPQGRVLQPRGDWTVLLLGSVVADLGAELHRTGPADRLDLAQLGRVDLSGAFVLSRAVKSASTCDGTHKDFTRLAKLVPAAIPARLLKPASLPLPMFERIGRCAARSGAEAYLSFVFVGRLVEAFAVAIRHPHRFRLTPLFAVIEQAGIDAIPIVMTMTFFIGAVIALVGANMLSDLGVTVFTVELVGIAVLREFGVVVAAILLAGRSASAFAAEIGSMKIDQEVDAMGVMGIDRFDALVLPRVLAALLMLPIMTLCADIGGLAGGVLVSWATLDINPVFFLQRTLQMVTVTQFWLGMIKAPFLAMVIAVAGCRHGLTVGSDVASLGRAVTTAVVQSIFMIIMIDAIFAVIFRVLGL